VNKRTTESVSASTFQSPNAQQR